MEMDSSRSEFHHSMNYRSVVILTTKATLVEEPEEEKNRAMEA
jgi:nitroimidazol reductase NimA-like FMN-containing flavoprotein (pyridoxamine 5'-phosphate oxidase superfamily)